MEKWADYLVSAVRYDYSQSYIVQARLHIDNGKTIGNAFAWNRGQIVSAIEQGYSFITIYLREGTWNRGEDVHTVIVRGVTYIRTDSNYRAADNLGNLPTF